MIHFQHPMTLEYAEWLSGELVERISPFVEHLTVAGSIRRKRERVGDIEIVAQPYLDRGMFGGDTTPALHELRASIHKIARFVKNGPKYIRFHLIKTEQYVDLFLVSPPARWGSILAIRTGPADLGKYVVTKCRDHGFMHTSGHARRLDGGEVEPTDTEAQFFALAEVECVLPELRDVQIARIRAASG